MSQGWFYFLFGTLQLLKIIKSEKETTDGRTLETRLEMRKGGCVMVPYALLTIYLNSKKAKDKPCITGQYEEKITSVTRVKTAVWIFLNIIGIPCWTSVYVTFT